LAIADRQFWQFELRIVHFPIENHSTVTKSAIANLTIPRRRTMVEAVIDNLLRPKSVN
jgi:hypothetical protein